MTVDSLHAAGELRNGALTLQIMADDIPAEFPTPTSTSLQMSPSHCTSQHHTPLQPRVLTVQTMMMTKSYPLPNEDFTE